MMMNRRTSFSKGFVSQKLDGLALTRNQCTVIVKKKGGRGAAVKSAAEKAQGIMVWPRVIAAHENRQIGYSDQFCLVWASN